MNPILINLKIDNVHRIYRLGDFYITLKFNTQILNLTDKGLAGFTKKINLWKHSINSGDYSRFPALHEFPEDTDLEMEDNENSVFVKYISKMTVYIDEYYPANNVKPIMWV